MKRQITGVLASVAAAVCLVVVNVAAQEAQTKKPAEVTLTGCLVQGSTPAVFLLDKAKQDPSSQTEQAKSYVVINKVEDVDLTKMLNHQVRVRGTAGPAVPTNPAPEKSLPTLTASAVASVADTCATPGR